MLEIHIFCTKTLRTSPSNSSEMISSTIINNTGCLINYDRVGSLLICWRSSNPTGVQPITARANLLWEKVPAVIKSLAWSCEEIRKMMLVSKRDFILFILPASARDFAWIFCWIKEPILPIFYIQILTSCMQYISPIYWVILMLSSATNFLKNFRLCNLSRIGLCIF